MERPWGLSGPEFLKLYWIGLAVAVGFAIYNRVRVKHGNDEPVRSLRLDELAYLAGGPKRVVEASVAWLVDAGALRPSRKGAVQVTGAETSLNPVDKAVLEQTKQYTNRTVNLLIPAVARENVVTSIGATLTKMGLIVDEDRVGSQLRRGAVGLWLLLVVGVVRWVNGIAIGAPIGWLTLQLALTGLLIFLFSRRGQLMRTAKGDRVIEENRVTATSGTMPEYASAAGLVALGGFAVYPDMTVRTALLAAPISTSGGYASGSYSTGTYTPGYSCSSGSSGSSCSSGGGSSCGGGGGGGGCGGGGSG